MRTLMPIRTTGSRVPLFCIHGEPLKMAQVLDEDQPLYGIYNAYDPNFQPPDSLEKLAALYLREARLVQPSGPYYLVGFCVGGLAAFEMARQLLAIGEEVAYLGLIDPTNPGRSWTRAEWIKSGFAHKGLRFQALVFFIKRAFKALASRSYTAWRLIRAYTYELLGKEMPLHLRQVRHTGQIKDAFADYRYKPTELPGVIYRPEMDAERIAESEEYWGEIFAKGANFITIEGLTNHFEFMREPYHTQVTEMIAKDIRRIQSG